MEMAQIRYVLAAAKQLNFTKAAADCNVTQPALTKGVKNLEEELGSPVFHYAVLAEELWINGGRHRTTKPVYVVFDSGTTGALVDRELFESSARKLG